MDGFRSRPEAAPAGLVLDDLSNNGGGGDPSRELPPELGECTDGRIVRDIGEWSADDTKHTYTFL